MKVQTTKRDELEAQDRVNRWRKAGESSLAMSRFAKNLAGEIV